MAEVLPPLSPPTDRASLIHARPSSTENFHAAMSSSQQQQQQQHNQHQNHHHQPPQQSRFNRAPYNNFNSQYGPPTGYRGTAAGPPASYGYNSAQMRTGNRQDSHMRNSSAPMLPPLQTFQPMPSENASAANRQRYPATSSISTTSSGSGSSNNPPTLPPLAKDDSSLVTSFSSHDFSAKPNSPASVPMNSSDKTQLSSPAKATPERYRRGPRRNDPILTSLPAQPPQVHLAFNGTNGLPTFDTGKMGQFFYAPQKSVSPHRKPVPSPSSETRAPESPISKPVDRTTSPASSSERPETPKRYRRQASSGNGVEPSSNTLVEPPPTVPSPKEPSSPIQSNTRQDYRPSSSGSSHRHSSSSSRNDPSRSVSSTDAARRAQTPSPLSKPAASGGGTDALNTSSPPAISNSAVAPSPAVAAMAALNLAADKDANKGVKSRIRRAFSFGSAQELKKATAEPDAAADKAKARQEQFSSEIDEEQDAVAKQQEAGGLGNNIYSGQGGVFTGSTDNLSISSTASSASLMLRKMGKGMKKGGRSIKGLFRPKSVIGVPAADGPSQASIGQVTMVSVEAEREKVNVNADPHAQPGGGTGFPKLERNSLETGRLSLSNDASTSNDLNEASPRDTRKTIIGGEQDRAEALAAVKRGILKRTGTSSPVTSPSKHPADGPGDQHSSTTTLVGSIERQASPAPSTTSSEPRRNGHRRTDSHTLEGDDYFTAAPRLQGNHSSRSLPGTPRSVSRNITFSPRLQFYDVWSSSEYDRRGDIATCNRLTPMLAQQIKEELNNFKMEMEVHELSKPHTHFF